MRNACRVPRKFAVTIACIALFCALPALAQETVLKVTETPPPAELAQAFRDTLDTKAVQILAGEKPIFEFWFRKDIPLTANPPAGQTALDAIKEVTFLGAVRVHETRKDFRKDDIEKGVYTLRLGIIPEDGNHLGTTPFPYMAVLVPAKYDTAMDAINDHDTLAKTSGKDTYDEHPNTLSMQPLKDADGEGEFPRLAVGGDDWKFLYLKLPAKTESGEAADLIFGLVYEGHGEI
ncbi:MAG: hypothetical protein IT364_22305 [Candidatus Hydrogenedentes bacterium]|nr:hypothetical protein [Candidatus Hydrogenedentota bacterium]